ncbi:hypothetical protein BJ508DRAFT_363831 [Ascobolus immersus RN42]|uniref:BTB domain-containing protein n=1 Tax=Ascobolus immersus RN42 TaxID=1160509 RepID=A0A3N4HX47_ASCIM|nr:hypothetical protein BJ508DRAFT_363831 [Ascobolus immersus RN42]
MSDRALFPMSLGLETIRVVVGSNLLTQRVYRLHTSILRQHSEYFERLFTFNGAEVAQKEIHLGEDFDGLGDAFDAFVEYIYTGKYEERLIDDHFLDIHAEVIVLATRLVVDKLQEMATNMLRKRISKPIDPSTGHSVAVINRLIRIIYEGTHRPYGDAPSSKEQQESLSSAASKKEPLPDPGRLAARASPSTLERRSIHPLRKPSKLSALFFQEEKAKAWLIRTARLGRLSSGMLLSIWEVIGVMQGFETWLRSLESLRWI